MKPSDPQDDVPDDDAWAALVRDALSMPAPPPELTRDVRALWPAAAPRAGQLPPWRGLVGRPRFDSWLAPWAWAGERAMPSESRRLIFTAGYTDLDLRLDPAPKGYVLSGQHLGEAATGRAELVRLAADGPPAGAASSWSAAIGSAGEFAIEGLGEGTYLLRLLVGGDTIVLPPLRIGPRHDQASAV